MIVEVEAAPTRISKEVAATETMVARTTKHNLTMVRLRLRGLSGAKVEFLLAATVQNFKRRIKIDAIPLPQPMTA